MVTTLMSCKLSLFLSLLGLCVLKSYSNTINRKCYPVESKELFVPQLEEVVDALNKNLIYAFEKVKVSIVDCPDLREKPFSLALEGLGGTPTLFECGSDSYLLPIPDRSKVYDFRDIPEQTGVVPTFIVGAAAAPFLYLKTAGELIANLNITDDQVHSRTQIGIVKDGNMYTEVLPDDVSTYAFTGNFLISQGLPGKVIEVKVSKRISDDDFPSTIRAILMNAFPNRSVGVGGTFLIRNSRVNIHVQPQFAEVPLENSQMRDKWLKFFNVDAPMVAVGTMITEDAGLSLRPYHFHCFSDHAAGHYHYDLDKDTVEYLGYFAVAEKVVRVDKPLK